jgi:hypothetical protein
MDRVAALRLPAIYDFPETAEEGGFAAYGPRLLSQLFVEVIPQQIIRGYAHQRHDRGPLPRSPEL